MASELIECGESIAAPLLRRVLNDRAGFVVVVYAGEWPDEIEADVERQFLQAGVSTEHVELDHLGRNPVAELRQRQSNSPKVFSIRMSSELLRIGNRRGREIVNALNLHRDGFRDANLCAIFWVPEANARTFFEAAANFIDYRTRLVEVGIDDTSSRSFIPRVVTIHNLPYASLGPIYLDQRAEELASLDAALKEHRATVVGQPIAIQGLGGIGKTRLAVEYAWSRLSDYTHVLFVRADSPDILRTHLANLAHPQLLNLPEDQDADEWAKYRAVVDWLATKPGWLLIVDNADDEHAAEAVDKLLPKLDQGSVIITSRYRRWSGEVQRQDLGMLTPAAAKSVLLDETQGFRSETSTDDEDAEQLADRLGYLPLALVQAAAYIRVHGITVDEYLQLWKQESRQVQQWHDDRVMNYPHSVAVTWQISVDLLEGRGKYAALSLLNLMAWLSPEPIPRTLFESLGTTNRSFVLPNLDEETAKSIEWTPPLIEARLNDLADYNLIKLEHDTISVHRVVQEILRTRQEQPRDWLQSTLYLLAEAVPNGDPGDVRTWPAWEPLRPHVSFALEHALKHGIDVPTSHLLGQLAVLLFAKALFRDAEPLMRRALAIDEQSYGAEHPSVAIRLNNLSQLLQATNRLAEAEPLMRRALAIDEQSYGAEHPRVATDLSNLATLLQATNRLAEAEPLMRRALAIDEQSYGAEHPLVAIRLNNLAQLLQATNRLAEAEPLMRRALAIDEQSYGAEHPEVAIRLNNLAQLLQDTNRLAEAEPLMRRALAIDEQSYGAEHPRVAIDLNNLAQLLQATNRLAEAEPLMARAVTICEKSYGDNHPNVATALNNLALLLQATNRLAEAEPLMRRALAIDEQSYGAEHPDVARDLNNLGGLLKETNRLAEAEPLVRQAWEIFDASLGPEHPSTMTVAKNLQWLLEAMGREQ